MKSDKGQTYYLIGAALLIFAGILLFVFMTQPRIYRSNEPREITVTVITNEALTESKTEPETEKTTKPVEYPLNINTATLEELMTIDGLGEKRASAIIEYREHLGGYTSVEQILEIEGFGKETYEKTAGYLTV